MTQKAICIEHQRIKIHMSNPSIVATLGYSVTYTRTHMWPCGTHLVTVIQHIIMTKIVSRTLKKKSFHAQLSCLLYSLICLVMSVLCKRIGEIISLSS